MLAHEQPRNRTSRRTGCPRARWPKRGGEPVTKSKAWMGAAAAAAMMVGAGAPCRAGDPPMGGAKTGGDAPSQGVDSSIPEYKPGAGVSGKLSAIGSDTLGELMQLWAEGFSTFHSVIVNTDPKGSSAAPKALI